MQFTELSLTEAQNVKSIHLNKKKVSEFIKMIPIFISTNKTLKQNITIYVSTKRPVLFFYYFNLNYMTMHM